uniref:Uncharacterized protein n=1 Tax=Entomoneis paludosa TaxID=265537 RepID=A0A7S3DX36_9STRA|mmetsp:Transcript_6828/g.14253  ORF Transcript_6828/g.14253 Transcript_6828/m.14253 type:complete len:133 (+) Transcript_6828:94-492(+)
MCHSLLGCLVVVAERREETAKRNGDTKRRSAAAPRDDDNESTIGQEDDWLSILFIRYMTRIFQPSDPHAGTIGKNHHQEATSKVLWTETARRVCDDWNRSVRRISCWLLFVKQPPTQTSEPLDSDGGEDGSV